MSEHVAKWLKRSDDPDKAKYLDDLYGYVIFAFGYAYHMGYDGTCIKEVPLGGPLGAKRYA